MYKVEFLNRNTTRWTIASQHGNEENAIINARSVANRTNVANVRVVDPRGSAVFFI